MDTAFELLLTCTEYLTAQEYLELSKAVGEYTATGVVAELSCKAVKLAFALIKSSLDNETLQQRYNRKSKSEAGKKGAEARWQNDGKNSNNSKDGTAISAISCHSVPCSEIIEDKEESSLSPSSPQTPYTPSTLQEEIRYNNTRAREEKPLTLEERKVNFGKGLEQYTGDGPGQYPREMVLRFFRYWTEHNPRGKKMRYEMQPTWDTAGRLRTWSENDNNKITNARNSNNTTDTFASKEELDGREYGESTI